MKILFVDNTLWALVNFRKGIISHLVRQGHDVYLLAPEDENYGNITIPEGATYIPITLNRSALNPLTDLGYSLKLLTIYAKLRPHYVFHYTIKPNIYGSIASRLLGIRSTSVVAGLGHVFMNEGILYKLIKQIYKFGLSFSNNTLVLNESNLNTLVNEKIIPAHKIIWLKGGEGVNLTTYHFMPMPRNTRPVFLMMSRLLADKGYNEFVAAAKQLSHLADFRIMGPIDANPSAIKIEQIRADEAGGYITYIPYSPDVKQQILMADCIVLPSFYSEGLSRVLMEALSTGRPVITTDIPGCRETVINKHNGYICKPKDVATLTEAMQQFISLSACEKEEMGRNSRKLAEERFDEQSVIAVYDNLLQI